MAAHRAWRIAVDSVNNGGRNCCAAGEIEFLATMGGSDLTDGAPGTAIGASSGYGAPANAFDGANNTLWHNSCDGTMWIGWDSGASSDDWFEATCFAWTARDSNEYAPQDSIKVGGLEWTDDDPASSPTWHRLWACLPQAPFTISERRVIQYEAPPTNDGDGHRYWRVLQYRNNTGQTGIAELQLAKTAGGVNLCSVVGGTPSASGNYGGYEPYRAFDGVTNSGSSEWAVSGGRNSQHWLAWDFGAGHAFTINEVRIAPMTDNGATPRTFAVQWSDDGAAWTTHYYGLYDGTYSYGSFHAFTKPTPGPTHRYLGFFNTMSAGEKYYGQSAGSYLDLVAREVEMAAFVTGPNICVGGSGHWYPASDAATNLFDGNYGSEAYNGGGGCTHCAVWYDFGSPTAIAEIRYTRGDGYNSNYFRSPGEGEFIYSDDGKGWSVGNSYSDVTYTAPPPGTSDTGSIVVDPISGGGPPIRKRAIIVT